MDAPDDRAPLAQAFAWSATITAIALEMVLPALVGLWIDRELGTKMVFLILGAIFGMAAGMFHLIRIAIASGEKATRHEDRKGEKGEQDTG